MVVVGNGEHTGDDEGVGYDGGLVDYIADIGVIGRVQDSDVMVVDGNGVHDLWWRHGEHGSVALGVVVQILGWERWKDVEKIG